MTTHIKCVAKKASKTQNALTKLMSNIQYSIHNCNISDSWTLPSIKLQLEERAKLYYEGKENKKKSL